MQMHSIKLSSSTSLRHLASPCHSASQQPKRPSVRDLPAARLARSPAGCRHPARWHSGHQSASEASPPVRTAAAAPGSQGEQWQSYGASTAPNPVTCSSHPAARPGAPASSHAQHDANSTLAATYTTGSSSAWQQKAAKLLLCGVAAAAVVSCLMPFAASAATAAATAAGSGTEGSLVSKIISFILHLDKHLSDMIATHGQATYAILWAIVFCETGLVVTPFLPGDSLLFAAGAFAGMGKLSVPLLAAVFISSAVLGDAFNYAIGNKLGKYAVDREVVPAKYIKQTEAFYAKYGAKTVVLARFVPIVRTFAPFVAGVGSMAYGRFALYNVAGAVLWTVLFVGAGCLFGNLPVVQHNFTLVVLAIVAVSVLPVVFEVIQARKAGGHEGGGSSNPAGGQAPSK